MPKIQRARLYSTLSWWINASPRRKTDHLWGYSPSMELSISLSLSVAHTNIWSFCQDFTVIPCWGCSVDNSLMEVDFFSFFCLFNLKVFWCWSPVSWIESLSYCDQDNTEPIPTYASMNGCLPNWNLFKRFAFLYFWKIGGKRSYKSDVTIHHCFFYCYVIVIYVT